MELYLQQNANKVDAVAKEKEAGQNQKENRKAQKVRFHTHVGTTLKDSLQISTPTTQQVNRSDGLSDSEGVFQNYINVRSPLKNN